MKIRNTKHLKEEKEKLRKRRAELEKALKYDWRDVKESLTPSNLAEQAFASVFREKDEVKSKNLFLNIINGISEKLAKKFGKTAAEKVDEWLNKKREV